MNWNGKMWMKVLFRVWKEDEIWVDGGTCVRVEGMCMGVGGRDRNKL